MSGIVVGDWAIFKRYALTAVAFILMTVCVSCSHPDTQKVQNKHDIKILLDKAEIILDTDPSAAQAALDSIDDTVLKGRQHALYAMLKTQSDYKCYVDIPSDSLIRIATDYYGTRRKSWRAAMSWYSLGCVNTLKGNDLVALDSYLKAMSLYPDTTTRYYALCLQNTGRIYLNRNMPEEAEHTLSQCLYHPACDEHGDIYYTAKYSLAQNALHSEDFVLAENIISMLLQDSLLPKYYRTDALLQLAKIQYYDKKSYRNAIELCDSNIAARGAKPSGAAMSIKADSYFAMQEYDSAYYYFNKSLESSSDMFTKCIDSRKLVELSIILDRSGEAISYLKLYNVLRDSIYEYDKSKELTEIIQRQRIEEHERTIKYRQTVYGGLLVFLFVACSLSILLLFETRKKRLYRQNADFHEILLHKQEELMRQEEELHRNSIAVLESKIRSISADNPDAHSIMLQLYAQKLSECRMHFINTDAGKRLISIKANGDRSLKVPDIETILKQLTLSYSDIIRDIYLEAPNVNQYEVQTLLLQSLNCSNELIAALDMKVTPEGIHKRKYRLQAKCGNEFYSLFVP